MVDSISTRWTKFCTANIAAIRWPTPIFHFSLKFNAISVNHGRYAKGARG